MPRQHDGVARRPDRTPRRFRQFFTPALASLTLLFSTATAFAQDNVLTRSYNNRRTGAYLNEKKLNVSNVNPGQFGKLFARPVDGEIYAQPLVMSNMNIGGKVRNVVFVATMHDSLYAFDADDLNASAPLWKTSYINPGAGITAIPVSDVGQNCGTYRDVSLEIGILGTPVIDPTTSTLYVVARTKEVSGNQTNYVQRLHAVDIFTGLDKLPAVVIQGSVPGTGDGSSAGVVPFNSRTQNQRPGLLLSNGTVFIAWSSHCDTGPYHGWVMAYNATTLQQTGIYCTTPNGWAGGIWQSGQGPSADDNGNIYVVAGNGGDSAKSGGADHGNSIIKLNTAGGALNLVDFFMPYTTQQLNDTDQDLAAGPVFIPGTNYIVSGGKDGRLYVNDTNNMGGFRVTDNNQIVQDFPVSRAHSHGSVVFWNSPTGMRIYMWPEQEPLKAFRFDNGQFQLPPYSQTTYVAPGGMPGGMLTISADGSKAGSAVLWANINFSGDANQEVRPGILRAFDPDDMTHEIWNSEMLPDRDRIGNFAKFCPPTVVNGKVYMATFSSQLVVYGLLPAPDAVTLSAGAGNGYAALTWTTSARASFYTVKRASVSGGPYTNVATNLTQTNYTDTSLTNGTTYYYVVTATNGSGESPNSNEQAVTPQLGLPIAPTNLTAASGDKQIALDWNVTPGAATYTLKRSNTDGGPYTSIATGLTTNGYTDTGLTNGTTYYYVVTAVNPAGEGPKSNQASAAPNPLSGGALGEYYNDPNNGTYFNSLALTRIDPTIDFDWGGGGPGNGVANDDFSVRWTGLVIPQFSQTYTFYTRSDDGVRLWVNNQLVVDKWILQSATEWSGTIALTAGQPATVKMEFYEHGGDAVAQLRWSSPSQTKQIIPSSRWAVQTAITGRMVLPDCRNSAQPFAMELRPVGGGASLFRTVQTDINGGFKIIGVPANNYTLLAKGSKWLRKAVPVNTSKGGVSGLTVSPGAGDANNDNTVNFDDFQILADAYFTTQNEAGFDDRADFNCDGSVDFDDFQLLADFYFTDGDE